MQKRDIAALAGYILLCLAVAALGGLATAQSVQTWYPTLIKPSWTPPPWLFGPVWTLLYIMMGTAAWLVWRKGVMAKPALLVFYLQLLLNLMWSILFFGMQSPLLGLVDIVVLWVTIAVTIRMFYAHSGWAAVLLVPYIAWVSFATALNAAIFALN